MDYKIEILNKAYDTNERRYGYRNILIEQFNVHRASVLYYDN